MSCDRSLNGYCRSTGGPGTPADAVFPDAPAALEQIVELGKRRAPAAPPAQRPSDPATLGGWLKAQALERAVVIKAAAVMRDFAARAITPPVHGTNEVNGTPIPARDACFGYAELHDTLSALDTAAQQGDLESVRLPPLAQEVLDGQCARLISGLLGTATSAADLRVTQRPDDPPWWRKLDRTNEALVRVLKGRKPGAAEPRPGAFSAATVAVMSNPAVYRTLHPSSENRWGEDRRVLEGHAKAILTRQEKRGDVPPALALTARAMLAPRSSEEFTPDGERLTTRMKEIVFASALMTCAGVPRCSGCQEWMSLTDAHACPTQQPTLTEQRLGRQFTPATATSFAPDEVRRIHEDRVAWERAMRPGDVLLREQMEARQRKPLPRLSEAEQEQARADAFWQGRRDFGIDRTADTAYLLAEHADRLWRDLADPAADPARAAATRTRLADVERQLIATRLLLRELEGLPADAPLASPDQATPPPAAPAWAFAAPAPTTPGTLPPALTAAPPEQWGQRAYQTVLDHTTRPTRPPSA